MEEAPVWRRQLVSCVMRSPLLPDQKAIDSGVGLLCARHKTSSFITPAGGRVVANKLAGKSTVRQQHPNLYYTAWLGVDKGVYFFPVFLAVCSTPTPKGLLLWAKFSLWDFMGPGCDDSAVPFTTMPGKNDMETFQRADEIRDFVKTARGEIKPAVNGAV